MHSINKSIAELSRLNLELADELLKLPEIRTFQTHSVCLALENFMVIYKMAPEAMDELFEQINKIGLPQWRDFCTPLQAIFWLVQDEKMEDAGTVLGLNIAKTTDADGHCTPILLSEPDPLSLPRNPLPDLSLDLMMKKILDAAWKRETVLIRAPELHNIIQRIRSQEEKEEYALLIQRHSNRQLQGYVMDDFMTKKDIFDTRDRETIKHAIRHSRWKQFFTVADRLNAPRLISYYIDTYFNFRKTPAHGVYLTFYKNRAQCTDAAYFAQYMLQRGGYKTFIRSVKWDEDPWDGLHTGAGIVLEDGSYQLVSNYTGVNSVAGGPYKDIASLDEKLSGGKKIIDSKWGAYYPPRHY